MQAALAKGLGVSKDKIHVDFDTKSVAIDLDGAAVDKAAVAKALEATGRYSLKE